MRAVRFICARFDFRHQVTAHRQLDTVLRPCNDFAIGAAVGFQPGRGNELEAQERVDFTLYKCLSYQLQLSLPDVSVCGLDYPFIRLGCSPSSLYTFPLQGLARDYHFTGFPEFDEVSSNCRQLDRQSIYRVVICTCHRGVVEQIFDLFRSDRDEFGYRWIDAAVVEDLAGFNKFSNCQPSRRRTDAHAVGVARRCTTRFPGGRCSQRSRDDRIVNGTPDCIRSCVCITGRWIDKHLNLVRVIDQIRIFIRIHCNHSTRVRCVRQRGIRVS